jgi:hypothetical protein
VADIDIQERRGSAWPWIIGLLALVLVIWVAVEAIDDEGDDMAVTDPAEEVYPADVDVGAPAAPAIPAEVMTFDQQCASGEGMTEEMARAHEFTVSCVRQLAGALQAVIQRDTVGGAALAAQLEQLRTKVDGLSTNPASPEHSTALAEVMSEASSLINQVEEDRLNGSDALERRAGRVQAAVDSFDADGVLLDQRDAIVSFFREASSALRALASQEMQ